MADRRDEHLPEVVTVKTVRALLKQNQDEIEKACPKFLDAERMMRVALTAVRRTPKLLDCDQTSLLGAVIESATLGLLPDGILGHSWLLPFWNSRRKCLEVQMIIGYPGYISLAHRSGHISTVQAMPVFEKDDYEFQYGTEQFLHHKPAKGNRGDLVAVWAQALMRDGSKQFINMWGEEVEEHRKMSQQADTGPWQKHPAPMWQKTGVIVLCKQLPLSSDMERAVSLDRQADAGESQNLGTRDEDVLTIPDPDADHGQRRAEDLEAELEKAVKGGGRPPADKDSKPPADAPPTKEPAPHDQGEDDRPAQEQAPTDSDQGETSGGVELF